MLAIIGTVPDENFPLATGKISLKNNQIYIQGKKLPVGRGTMALMAAAIKTCEAIDIELPFGFLVGDTGLGKGSRYLYDYLTKNLTHYDFNTITFHYLQPDVDWHNRIFFTIQEMGKQPILIADAGFMYAAKMSGQARKYDLFTPDTGELAFLADEKAPHPFYTRGFILHEKKQVPELIERAYKYENAASCVLIKGQPDQVADKKGIFTTVDHPVMEAMEAIGGTGDTLTGVVSALIESGMEIKEAAPAACLINRLAGYYSKPTCASQIADIVTQIPRSVAEVISLSTSS